ncbi:MAG: RNA-guided endonuclease InsQ/TnpB family protein [Candidatus Methanospirareceae archaeon]
MEVIKAVKFKYRGDLNELFEDFKEMIEFCIDKALKLGITSYAKLRKAVYGEWKHRWYPRYHTHYCHSACKITTAILKNFRKRKRKGLTNKDKPEVKEDFVKLEEILFKFEGDRVKIVTSPRSWITVNLVVGEYQREFVEAWKRGELDVGEIIVKRDFIVIPFKKGVEFKNIKAVMTIDINEKNVTYSIFDEKGDVIKTVRLDIYKVKRIHDEHSKKREKIQKKLAKKPHKMRKILKKYSRREKRRIEDYLHKISSIIVSEAVKYNAKIVMEDLKYIRNSVNRKSKSIRRRLNRWNFRKLQFFIEYKAKWNGLSVDYVKAYRTSSLCPICGCRLNPNGQRLLKCKKCGVTFDRDVVATLNIFKSGCGEFRSSRTLPDEVRLIKPDGTGELLKVVEYYEKLLKPS